MDSLKVIHNFWSSKLSQIPEVNAQEQQLLEAAGLDKLEEYGALVQIDSLVKAYPGTYTHDDIFKLNLGLVYQLMAINKQRDYIQSTAHKLRPKK